MFTVKFYTDNGFRQRILTAESLTVLRGQDAGAEITLHQKNSADDTRIDVAPNSERKPGWPDVYQKAIVENAAGKTTEIITLGLAIKASSEPPANAVAA